MHHTVLHNGKAIEVKVQVDEKRGSLVMTVDQPDGVSLGWEALQELKNKVLGVSELAIEVYPPACDVVNEINRRWLWVVPADFVPKIPTLLVQWHHEPWGR